MEHQGRVAVVTGGGKGIGRGTVEVLIRAGAKVIMLDVDAEGGQQTADALGDNAHFIACNVAEEQAVIDALRQGVEHFGKINYLINNAGVQRYAPVTETTEEMWDLTMNVNVKGAFLCAKHAIPHMQQTGQGVIVNVSSVLGILTQGNVAAYTTSKTALLGLTRSIAVELCAQHSLRGGVPRHDRHSATAVGHQPVSRPGGGDARVHRHAPGQPYRATHRGRGVYFVSVQRPSKFYDGTGLPHRRRTRRDDSRQPAGLKG